MKIKENKFNVKIEKEKAFKWNKLERIVYFFFFTTLWFFIIRGVIYLYEHFLRDNYWGDEVYSNFLDLNTLIYVVIFMLIWEVKSYIYYYLGIKNVKVEIDTKNKVISGYKKIIITEFREYRLQIVNDIQIEQSLGGSLFGLFRLSFKLRDYENRISLSYLSYEEANRIKNILQKYNVEERKDKYIKVDMVNN